MHSVSLDPFPLFCLAGKYKGSGRGPHSVSRGGGEAMGHAEKDLKMLGKQKGAEAEAPSLNGRANLSSPFSHSSGPSSTAPFTTQDEFDFGNLVPLDMPLCAITGTLRFFCLDFDFHLTFGPTSATPLASSVPATCKYPATADESSCERGTSGSVGNGGSGNDMEDDVGEHAAAPEEEEEEGEEVEELTPPPPPEGDFLAAEFAADPTTTPPPLRSPSARTQLRFMPDSSQRRKRQNWQFLRVLSVTSQSPLLLHVYTSLYLDGSFPF